ERIERTTVESWHTGSLRLRISEGATSTGSEQHTFSRFSHVAFRLSKAPIRGRALNANGVTMHDREDPLTNPSKTHTDLPLLPGGNNGNTAAAPPTRAVEDISQLFQDV